jgi:hypothetical protein
MRDKTAGREGARQSPSHQQIWPGRDIVAGQWCAQSTMTKMTTITRMTTSTTRTTKMTKEEGGMVLMGHTSINK